jgi:subtilase family serine protease
VALPDASVLLGGVAAAIPAHASSASSDTLAGTHPSWASARLDKGGLAATRDLSIQVYLAGRDPAGLAAYAAAVSNSGSAAYHRYLTPAAERAAFGPTTAQVAAVLLRRQLLQRRRFLKVFANIVDTRSATLVSDSWGEVMYSTSGNLPQALVDEYEQIFEQGAVEGIGFYFSSGDCANEDPNTGCGANSGSIQKQTDYPNSDPWATAVGGTSLAVGKSGNYQWETAWGTDETR